MCRYLDILIFWYLVSKRTLSRPERGGEGPLIEGLQGLELERGKRLKINELGVLPPKPDKSIYIKPGKAGQTIVKIWR